MSNGIPTPPAGYQLNINGEIYRQWAALLAETRHLFIADRVFSNGNGRSVRDLCYSHGIRPATGYNWISMHLKENRREPLLRGKMLLLYLLFTRSHRSAQLSFLFLHSNQVAEILGSTQEII
jgi:hypothetical protein